MQVQQKEGDLSAGEEGEGEGGCRIGVQRGGGSGGVGGRMG